MLREKLDQLRERLREKLKNRPRVAWDAHSNRIILVRGVDVDAKKRRSSHAPPKHPSR